MKRFTLKEFSENIQEIISANNNIAFITINPVTEVNYGDENDCDLKWAKEHNIPCYNAHRGGGTIVCSKGNVGIAIIYDVKYGWCADKFNAKLLEYLKHQIEGDHLFDENNQDYCHTFRTNHNDILIDGYKVASGVEMRVGPNLEKIYATFQISINQDIEAIEHICKKQMVKIPKALSDFGITTDQIVDFCDRWWSEFIIENNIAELTV